MGKCRDCIHHDVCKDFIDTAFDGFLDEGEEILYDDNDMNGDDCKYYACFVRLYENNQSSTNDHRSGGERVMATCKDCIHYEVCKKTRIMNPSHNYATECIDYKDYSQFVELPCKVGDFVYFIKARRVMADIVSKVTIDRRGVMLQRANGYNLGYTDQLGKKIFLTLEEAEQALKERGTK